MKNKGFTLIELLAVIVILAIIALIATPIILNIIDNTKESSKERSKELYLDAVEQTIAAYNMKNPLVDLSNAKCEVNTDGNLECPGVENAIIVEMDGEKPKSGEIVFKDGKINKENTKLSYEELSEFEKICDLEHDNDNSDTIALGDKYQCKVKDNMEADFKEGYYFYVLSYNNADGTVTKDSTNAISVNLIMDRNMSYNGSTGVCATNDNKGITAWGQAAETGYESISKVYGPKDSMDYLYSVTKDWNNISNIKMNYIDEFYGSIVTEGEYTTIPTKNYETGEETVLATYSNLKARMPYISEIEKYDRKNNTNAYLYDNLLCVEEYQEGVCVDGITHTNILGYWLMSGATDEYYYNFYAYQADYMGYVESRSPNYNDEQLGNGIRPVITLEI